MSLRITLRCDGPDCEEAVELDGADDWGAPAPQMTSGRQILVETGWIILPTDWTWKRVEGAVLFGCPGHPR